MKKNDELKKKEDRWIFTYILAIISIAFIINLLMSPSIPSISSIDAPTWLTFWGSYLGGAIGCLPAIAALQHSRRESRRQHEEFLQQQKEAEKDRHFSHLPMLDCVITYYPQENIPRIPFSEINAMFEIYPDHSQSTWPIINFQTLSELSFVPDRKFFLLRIKNVGFGPALSTKLQLVHPPFFSFGTLSVGDKFNLIVILHEPLPEHLISQFTFDDMLGWKYQQTHAFNFKNEKAVQYPISSPSRIS